MSINWYVNNNGSDLNGGGFDSSLAGTNYADQAAPQVTNTLPTQGISIGASTCTILSAAGIDDSNYQQMYGNYINMTASTGVTAGWYKIVSLSSRQTAPLRYIYNLDRDPRSLGTNEFITATVGGRLATVAQANTLVTQFGGTINNENIISIANNSTILSSTQSSSARISLLDSNSFIVF